jgi:hypothetical protein
LISLPRKGVEATKKKREDFVCAFCASWRLIRRGGGTGAGSLNKETKNPGENPVHGFMDSLST